MKKIKLTISVLLICLYCYGQDASIVIGGDSTFCAGSDLVFSIVHKRKDSLRYEWSYNGRLFPKSDSSINIFVEENIASINLICNIYTFRRGEKSFADSLVRTTILKKKINDNPKLNPKYFISGNSVLLTAGTSQKKFSLSWLAPNGDEFDGNIIRIDTPRIEQFGTYQLSINDTVTGCKSKAELLVKPEDQVQSKPSTVFGTIDGFEEDDNLLRIVERDVPVYLSGLDGAKKEDDYIIAYKGTRWQIIGEVENHYIIQFQTNYIDQKEQDVRRENILAELEILDSKIKSVEISLLSDISNRELSGELSGLRKMGKKLSKQLGKLPDDNDREEYFKFRETEVGKKRKYYLVDRVDFLSRSKPYRYINKWPPKFTAGTVLIPVKIRFDGFEFSKDITLGPFVGAKWLLSSYNPTYLSVGFTAGISSVRLTPENSDSTRVSTVTDLAAFSYSAGVIYENSRVQVGAFIGADLINNDKDKNGRIGYDWDYQNKPWISIGLGYSIINRPSNKSNKIK